VLVWEEGHTWKGTGSIRRGWVPDGRGVVRGGICCNHRCRHLKDKKYRDVSPSSEDYRPRRSLG
jgi:hypothetical protein